MDRKRLSNSLAAERGRVPGFRGKRWSAATLALPVLFLLSVILAASAWFCLSGFQRSAVRLRNARGMPFRAIVFEPQAARRPVPAIVVC